MQYYLLAYVLSLVFICIKKIVIKYNLIFVSTTVHEWAGGYLLMYV